MTTTSLSGRDYLFDLGDLLKDSLFYSCLEGLHAVRASMAGALKPDLNGKIFGDFEKLYIAAIGLKIRTNLFKHFYYAVFD